MLSYLLLASMRPLKSYLAAIIIWITTCSIWVKLVSMPIPLYMSARKTVTYAREQLFNLRYQSTILWGNLLNRSKKNSLLRIPHLTQVLVFFIFRDLHLSKNITDTNLIWHSSNWSNIVIYQETIKKGTKLLIQWSLLFLMSVYNWLILQLNNEYYSGLLLLIKIRD